MDKLFSSDSTLMRGLTVVADVMILNLLFILTSLPLVTLGASLTALNFTAMRIPSGACVSVSADYFRSFRHNFRQATVVGLLLALVTAALAGWYVVVTTLVTDAAAEFTLLAVWYVLAFSAATTMLFVFPYLANFEGKTGAVLRNAWLLSWAHPLASVSGLAVIVLAGLATLFTPQATGYGIFWLVAGFAAVAVVNGCLFTRVFGKHAVATPARPG